MGIASSRDVNLIVLDEALSRLGEIDLERSKVVELRSFAGLSLEETAEVLGVSPRTVKRSWRFAKAWLLREIGEAGPGERSHDAAV